MTKPTFRFPLPKTFRVSQTLKVWLLRRGVGLVLLLSVVAGLQLAAIGRAAADAPGPWPPPLPKSALPDTASRAAADTVDRAAATPALVDLAGLYPLQDVAQVVAGAGHTCALLTNGGVKCWGRNNYGQLGDGTITANPIPVDVVGLASGVAALSAGWGHTCALLTGGGVKCWGYNDSGQLGDGTTTFRATPVPVSGLSSGVRALAAGWYHTCALTSGGGVRCWGWNGDGQLGDETTTNQLAPVAATGLESGVSALAAGASHTCALTTSGGVQCWGSNASGQLGDGTTTSRATPVAVVGLSSGVSALAAGASHTCALLTGGGIQCWGANGFGQLGDGTTTDSLTPVAVAGLSSGVSALDTQSFHTCALLTGGGVQCWGNNDFGQLGDGTTLTRLAPVAVTGLSSGVSALAVGYFHTCGVMHDGSAQCWGANDAGQLGDGIAWRTTPGDVLTACFALARSHTGAGADPTVAPARTIGCPPDLYAAGQALTLTASPAAGWRVAGWRGTAVDSRATLTNTLVMPAADASAAVDYVAVRYTVYLPVLFSDR